MPRIGSELDHATLLEGLPDAEQTSLVYPKDMPPALGSPIGGEVGIGLIKATEWLLALTPHRLAELSAWIVGTYGAKEFAKGFAGEAGKDTWKAVKGLLQRIHNWSKMRGAPDGQAELPLRVKGEHLFSGQGHRQFTLVLDPRWNSSHPRLDQLERQLLAPVFITFAKTERDPSDERERYVLETAQMDIAPRLGTADEWWLGCEDGLETRILVLIDLSAHTFRWDKGAWKAGILAKLCFQSLVECGFTNKGETPLSELRRTETKT